MTLRATPIASRFSFGCRVSGLTMQSLGERSVVADLHRFLENCGLLVLEDIEPTTRMQLAISAALGPIKDYALDQPQIDPPEDGAIAGSSPSQANRQWWKSAASVERAGCRGISTNVTIRGRVLLECFGASGRRAPADSPVSSTAEIFTITSPRRFSFVRFLGPCAPDARWRLHFSRLATDDQRGWMLCGIHTA
jgi:hypothetical protein